MSELLPCPFCGAPAIKRWCMISCSKCWAIMHDPHADERYHIEMWNRRSDLTAARAKLEELTAQVRREWQPMDSAPKDGTNVLLINRKGNIASGLWQGSGVDEGWWIRGGHGPNTFFNKHHGPTHWMPLPAPPALSTAIAEPADHPAADSTEGK